jgi:ankyrin repeat protein
MYALSHALLPQLLGDTSLMEAARHGHVEVASLLLQRGANIEAKDNVRISTPLGIFGFFF